MSETAGHCPAVSLPETPAPPPAIDSRLLIVLACIAAVVALLRFEHRRHLRGRAISKLAASSAFLWLAWASAATDSDYGRWILLALALSWCGDLCLLSARSGAFLAGIGAFLLAHVAFAFGFATRPHALPVPAIALGAMAVAGLLVLRWLWPHLHGFFRGAVLAYVAAIVAMCALSIAAVVGGSHPVLAIGALAFMASDVAVARDRFVREAFVNRAWGLPLYYAAQLLLAWSCSTTAGGT